MKMHELFEARELPAPHKLSETEFGSLPAVSAGNVEGRFKVKNIAFDNEHGMGNTPNGQNVIYLGFVAEMTPTAFLSIVTPGDREEDAARFARYTAERATFASPFLEVSANIDKWSEGEEPLRIVVKGHEGRGRMTAFAAAAGAGTPIPVQFILLGGYRARDLKEEFFQELRSSGLVHQDAGKSAAPTKIALGRIFWNGQVL